MKKFLHPSKPMYRRIRSAVLWAMGYFAIGYVPTLYLQDPRASMVIAASAAIIVGVRALSPGRGILAGALCGIVGGAAIMRALGDLGLVLSDQPPDAQGRSWIYIVATALLSGAVAGIFAVLARRRRAIAAAQWDKVGR